MGFIVGVFIGFILGYIYFKSKENKIKPEKRTIRLNYAERQKAKVKYESDAERIRELNKLSHTETKFMRILQREFDKENIIVKNKRFYIADFDNFPLCIFEYRDGIKPMKNEDTEDGITLFLYKGIISSDDIKIDKEKIKRKFEY